MRWMIHKFLLWSPSWGIVVMTTHARLFTHDHLSYKKQEMKKNYLPCYFQSDYVRLPYEYKLPVTQYSEIGAQNSTASNWLYSICMKKERKKPNRSRVLVVLTVFPSIHKSLNVLLPPLVFAAEWRPVSMWVDKNNQQLVVIICVNRNNYVK